MAIGPGIQRAARLLAAGSPLGAHGPPPSRFPGAAGTVLLSDSSPQLGTVITNHELCNGQD
ncbi:hypothetical protein PCANC_17519 [Puccinia coronata f. sp. avenae]|uniref:Uncharacterized protein n=1 Tax=Puccinia coronata f. sp. avenae TaxID=200324 RepID=A0A2N5STY1_9BASI|nr:hypothetical protein PCANC_17519 [Puccinia coronata f. sp. avenae]